MIKQKPRGAMVEVACENPSCDATFTARVADRKRGWGRFCSKACSKSKLGPLEDVPAPMASQAGWKWYGFPGHYICASRCQYHLTTAINGKYLVSTVGRFVVDPLRDPERIEEVGHGRKYETMVFEMDGEDENGDPKRGRDSIDMNPYDESVDAERGHYAMCEKWASM